jgi:hypothetical protein
MKIHRSPRPILSLFFVTILFLGLSNCSRSTEKQESVLKSLNQSLVSRLPETTFAFFKWDGGSEPYQRLLKSPWAGTGDVSVYLGQHSEAFEDVAKLLQAAGVDIKKESFWTQTFSEAVFFISPSVDESSQTIEKGVVLAPKNKDIPQLFKALRAALGKKEISVTEVKAEGVLEAVEFNVERDGKKEKFVVGRSDKLVALAQSSSMVQSIIRSKAKTSPRLVELASKAGIFENLPNKKNRFAIGVIDFDSLPGIAINNVSQGASGVALCSMAMLKTPVTDFRYKPGKSSSFSAWQTKSNGKEGLDLLKSVRTKPLLYLDSDGVSIERIIQTLQARAKDKSYAENLADLEIPSRFSLAIDAKSSAKSFLPIPDFYLVFKTNNPSKLSGQLESLIGNIIKTQGALGGMAWSDKQIAEGVAVKMLASPIGFSIYLGTGGDRVVLSSSEVFLKNEMTSPGTADPKSVFKSGALGSLSAQASLGNALIDFNELAVLLESVGGTLRMFAPQQQSGQEILEEENIKKLKGLGALVAEIRLKKEILSVHSYYE